LTFIKDLLVETAAAWSAAGKIMQAVAAPVTAALILVSFSPTIQGYYYSFSSLLALQIFLELGLATVITTFSSHEWVRLRLDDSGRVVGNGQALRRLSGLALTSFRWYLVAGLILFGVLALGGTFFLSIRDEGASVGWQTPWLLLCAASVLTFSITPIWALLQGCGQISEVYRYKFVEVLAKSIVLWSCITAGAGLWSAGLTALFSALLAACFLWTRYRQFLASLLAGFESSFSVNWLREVFPLQWRVAVSWISGFFAFYLFTPAIFLFEGPEAAGQMGITWAIVSGISALASTFAQTRAPHFAHLVADRRFEELDRQAVQTGTIGVVLSLACGLAATGALLLAGMYWPNIASRFLPVGPVVLFLASDVLHQISVTQSTYLRAFRREPFMILSLAFGALVATGTILLTPTVGVTGPAISYVVAQIIGLAVATRIFVRARKEWTFPRS
jgi:O-antigen/teichoic acid export membrane protein